MTNIPDRGSDRTCTICAAKHANEHSMKQSGECDGIKRGVISGTRAMEIRLRNSGKGKRRED
jgi:hypothetical protein